MVVNTTGKTEFKRFAGDSVKYEDAKPGTLAQIQKNDQLQARGAKSADGTTIAGRRGGERIVQEPVGPDCEH